jgi:hypothetical protein
MIVTFVATVGVSAAIGASASGSSHATTNATSNPVAIATVAVGGVSNARATSGATVPAATAQAVAPTKPLAPKTVLTAQGMSTKNTARFSTSGDWTIHWSYDCAKFGGQGNFIVNVFDGSEESLDNGVNELGRNGTDTSPVYDDPGQHYLSVTSECSWQLTVTVP